MRISAAPSALLILVVYSDHLGHNPLI